MKLRVDYPDAERVVLVVDNLNTHALAQRLEIHHTPRHGSWLNVAQIEFSALTHQRRVRWHFTTSVARTRLGHVYPER